MKTSSAGEEVGKLRLLIAMGTRPEIIKQAPLVRAARAHRAVKPIVCHSGQHSDLAEPMLEYFDIRPDIHLELMQSFSTLASLVGGCMQRVEKVLRDEKIDVVVVQGDTATTAAMALASFYARVPVVHVEAGLRTGDLSSPWPEELNRRLTTLACSLHCAPTDFARQQLLKEGVAPEHVILSGNPVVDSLEWTLLREQADIQPDQPLVVLTAHRRENFGKPLEDICAAVLELADRFADHRYVFVTHPNPNAGPIVRSILDRNSRIEVAPPMTYPEFIKLLRQARLVISDSGGIQEEAPTLRVPLLITRESTERPEAVHCGAAELVGTDRELLVKRAAELLQCSEKRAQMTGKANPFGDGNSGDYIIQAIVERFGRHQ